MEIIESIPYILCPCGDFIWKNMPMWKIILKKLFLYAHVENTKVYAHVEVSNPPDFFLPLDVRRRTQDARGRVRLMANHLHGHWAWHDMIGQGIALDFQA